MKKKYYITFKDDYTRLCNTYFLRNKSKAFEMSNHYKIEVKN